ncbi:MAG: ribose 5-phosphate isomerase B [Anaerolineales bacterium]
MEIPSDAELNAIVHRVVNQTLAGQAPRGTPTSTISAPGKIIALGADHGGYALKETLKKHLEEKGYFVIDCGTHSTDAVDYPDFARAVAVLVSEGKAWRGIMIDGAGIGSCMAANKIPGVRASMCYDHATANNAREHNDANVLTLGAGLIGVTLAKEIADTWLTTPFAGGRHAKRVEKINFLDHKNS